MSVLHKQPAFNNVGANTTASITNLHQGDTCRALLLKLGGTTFTKAHLTGIRVKLGGKAVVDNLTGQEIDTINDYMGRGADAAYLMISFCDPNARTIDGEDIGGIDTSLRYGSFSIEVDIGGATAPTLECWMVKSPAMPNRKDRALFKAYTKATQSISAAGVYSMQPPLGSIAGNLINRIHFFHSNITKLAVKKNGLDIWDEGEIAVTQFIQEELNRVAQSGHLAYDPLYDNNQSNAVSTLLGNGLPAPLEFRTTLSASDTVIMIGELYTSIDRI